MLGIRFLTKLRSYGAFFLRHGPNSSSKLPDAESAREAALVHVADLPEHEKGPLETRLRDRSVE